MLSQRITTARLAAFVGLAIGAAGLAVGLAVPPEGAEAPAVAFPEVAPPAAGLPEAISPEAPLDAAALAELKRQLGHRPFAGTVFEPDAPPQAGVSPSLLRAAHLLDRAAYVLEQAEQFEPAEAIRDQAADLRAQAKAARAQPAPGPVPTPAVPGEGPAPGR